MQILKARKILICALTAKKMSKSNSLMMKNSVEVGMTEFQCKLGAHSGQMCKFSLIFYELL